MARELEKKGFVAAALVGGLEAWQKETGGPPKAVSRSLDPGTTL
ncbi:MAG: hypothetical protein ABI682_00870 [Acidobacteriota bacterium]